MLIINWPIVLVVTIALYLMIILTLPFGTLSTSLLFLLISFWSRLPGVGMPIHYLIIYATDLVDFFSLIIAVNIGGPAGAVFSLFANISSRVAGVFPTWKLTMEDAFGQVISCLLIPFIHKALGGDIFLSMIIYSVIRIIVVLPINFYTAGMPLPQYAIEAGIAIASLIAVNSMYAKFLGGYFDSLLQRGVQFSWTLFFFATAVILIFYVSVFGRSKRPAPFSITKIIKGRVKKSREKKRKKSPQDNSEIKEMENIKRSI